MLIVGAKRQTAFRALVSSASNRPASSVRDFEKVAPIQVALGRAEAGAAHELMCRQLRLRLTHMVERTSSSSIRSIGDLDADYQQMSLYKEPLSLGTHLGIFFLGTETVSHHPEPARSETFSSIVNCLTS
jgi:hypothetical protein